MSDWVFRRLEDSDLPMLHRWLNEPGVVRFWEGDDVRWPAVIAQYGSEQLRGDLLVEHPDFDYDKANSEFDALHTEVYLGLQDERPVGWIQCYAVDDYDDEAEVKAWLKLGFDQTGAGMDYLIGEPDERAKGLGSSMIRAFIDEIVFGQHPQWTAIGASPVHDNTASWGALAKAELTLLGSFQDPEFGTCDLYVERRPEESS